MQVHLPTGCFYHIRRHSVGLQDGLLLTTTHHVSLRPVGLGCLATVAESGCLFAEKCPAEYQQFSTGTKKMLHNL